MLADVDLTAGLADRRVGLLSNTASHIPGGETTLSAVSKAIGIGRRGTGERGLVRLFSPEHGWNLAHSAGDPVADTNEPVTGLPVYSLYKPSSLTETAELDRLDALIIDLPDVGVRCYTYAASAAQLTKAALDRDIAVYLCDRPNPLGATVAGPRQLDPQLKNFLAYFDVPFVHGLRLSGLFASVGLDEKCSGLNLIPCDAGCIVDNRDETQWHPPSPALPCPAALTLYPGLVLLEGTNMSEGRGTDKSFQAVLSPNLAASPLCRWGNEFTQFGFAAEPYSAIPQTGEYAGKACTGIALSPTGIGSKSGFSLGIYLLSYLRRLPDFTWVKTPQSGYFIDRLMGSRALRLALDQGMTPEEILGAWS